MFAALVGFVGFYLRAPQTAEFSDEAFTVGVEAGFFVALLGCAWACVGALSPSAAQKADDVMRIVGVVIATVFVAWLFSRSTSNAEAISPPIIPFPRATLNDPGS